MKSCDTYLKPLDDKRVLVIEARCCFFVLDSTDVLLDFPADDHNLPLAAILGDTTELGAALASCLQENRLVLTLDQHRVHVLDRLQLNQQVLLALLYLLLLLVDEVHGTADLGQARVAQGWNRGWSGDHRHASCALVCLDH